MRPVSSPGCLRGVIARGHLHLVDASGTHHFGTAGEPPSVTVRVHDRGLDWRRAFDPDDGLCDAYADGAITVETGTIRDLLELLAINHRDRPAGPAAEPVADRAEAPPPRGDPPAQLLAGFLDADLQFSSAYFTAPGNDLDQAQQDKSRLIAGKLLIEPGMRVLDIGSGFGGLAVFLGTAHGADVTGLALSPEQVDHANRRAEAAGLAGRVRFRRADYRDEAGSYDRVLAVGMLEHVGIAGYPAFFAKLRALLRPTGVGLVHFLGRTGSPGPLPLWMRRHFASPTYDIPALSQVVAAIEESRLLISDVEVLGQHYAETARHWYRRFRDNRDAAAAQFGERFCRLWEFGLAAGEMIVRHRQEAAIFQIQFAVSFANVPPTRGGRAGQTATDAGHAADIS